MIPKTATLPPNTTLRPHRREHQACLPQRPGALRRLGRQDSQRRRRCLCDYLSQHAVTHKPSDADALASLDQPGAFDARLRKPVSSIEVRRTLRGIKREHGAKPRRVSPALRDEVLAHGQGHVRRFGRDLRNRALLLVGLRRRFAPLGDGEAARGRHHLRCARHDLALGKTKTDQSGEHDEIAIPLAKGDAVPGESAQEIG